MADNTDAGADQDVRGEVPGTVFTLDTAQLAAADAYEVDAVLPGRGPLRSGGAGLGLPPPVTVAGPMAGNSLHSLEARARRLLLQRNLRWFTVAKVASELVFPGATRRYAFNADEMACRLSLIHVR